MQDNTSTSTNVLQKGLVTDFHQNMVSKDLWTFARNAQMNSHLGQINFIQNEPSNYKCVDLPYTPIGFIKLLRNRWAVFSTDNIDSEIGIFEENICIYTKLINDKCLNLNTSYLVQGVSKEMFDCKETIYWTDTFNPRRSLNIDDIPYKFIIKQDQYHTKEYTTELDCDSLLMETKVVPPCIQTYTGSGGLLTNGSYQFGIAYSINKSRVTEFYGISQPERLWTHENIGQAIDIQITNLDRRYDEYELIVIHTHDSAVDYKSLGFYNTGTTTHHITNVNRDDYTPISALEVVNSKLKYSHADLVTANDQYLLWAGLRTTSELDYQALAMNIESEYMVLKVPSDYYSKGGKLVGYNRDEVYAFGIQWLDENGTWSPIYHIPGRINKGDNNVASGRNVFESSLPKACRPTFTIKKWMVENTAEEIKPMTTNIPNCDGTFIGTGRMAYYESTELYPNNERMFGRFANKPIRHHKFPDNCKTHIHSDGGVFINLLSVRFKNIEPPKDKDGNIIKVIVGYRIMRANRDNNKTIIAKGIVTNMRNYTEDDQTVLYPNYPYNPLDVDPFLSSKQTFYKRGKEQGYLGLSGFKQNQFSFYSPDTLFSTTSLGDEVNFLTEELASTNGKFELTYKHPKQKLLTEADLYFALIIGAIDGYLSLRGKRVTTTYVDPKRTVTDPTGLTGVGVPKIVTTSGTTVTGDLTIVGDTELIAGNETVTGTTVLKELSHYEKANADHTHLAMEQYANDTIGQLNSVIASGSVFEKVVARALQVLAGVGMFAFFASKTAKETLDTIYQFSEWQDYAVQYNSHALFDTFQCVNREDRRRGIDHYQYIYNGINTVQNVKLNNFKRSNSVYLKISDDINPSKSKDTSFITLEASGSCDNIGKNIRTTASVFYTSIKRRIYDQYGQIETVEYQDTNGCVEIPKSLNIGENYTSSPIFGGDTFICKFAVKDSMHYFSQYLYDVPNGYIDDYRTHRNVGYPRYWMDSTPYDFSEFVKSNPTKSNLPQSKHNLSCPGNNSFDNITVVKKRYFYTSNNSVKEFFVESERNLDYRDWKGDRPSFYSRQNQDISNIFQSGPNIEKREEFIYNMSLSKQLTETTGVQQRSDFDPEVDEKCFQYIKNRVIYSLPAFKDQKSDNWKVNLLNNYYDFPLSEFGELTSMNPIDNQQIMFLFDKASPYVTIGRDELQLDGSGKKIVLGDGGLFAREPRPIAFTDYHYGNSQSKWAFNNTQFGSFYPSQRQGRTFSYTGKLEEFSTNGMRYWFDNYMPSSLLKQFPNFRDKDNPLVGVGMLSVFDNTQEKYYLTKRDYSLKDEYNGLVNYNSDTNRFKLGQQEINLKDTKYFEDASWTISYSPNEKYFVSWHDWHPDFNIQSEKHFLTVKNNAIWKHNNTTTSFCNFYGTQYPFALEYLVNNGQNVEILKSIEYQLEVGKYYNNGRDYNQVLDANFDWLSISNSEQLSGRLRMNLQSKTDMSSFYGYPKIDSKNNLIDVIYNKEEQKTRINQFWDIIRDRGEFSTLNFPLWTTQVNGYIKDINPIAVDYNKASTEQKKFRNNWHKILLIKDNPEDKKFIFKFANAKQTNSLR